MLSFRNFDTVLRSANFNDVQDPANLRGRNYDNQNGWIVDNGESLADGSRYWKQHPDGAGYYRGFWPLREENNNVTGGYVVISHRCFVLQVTRGGVYNYCNDLNTQMQGVIIRLREKIKLGEITPDEAVPMLKRDYDRILAEALDRARRR